jgi:hypothetical protein
MLNQDVRKEVIKFKCKWYNQMSAESEPTDISDGKKGTLIRKVYKMCTSPLLTWPSTDLHHTDTFQEHILLANGSMR